MRCEGGSGGGRIWRDLYGVASRTGGMILAVKEGHPMRPTSHAAGTDMPEDFPYGWRYVTVPGSSEMAQVPLTLEDVLHPLEGDVIPERIHHSKERAYLQQAFSTRDLRPPAVLVSSDLLTDFGVAGVRNMSPDNGVFVALNAVPEESTGLLRLGDTGGRCALAVEIVSPDTRENDVTHKHILYHRVKVEHYIIIDRWRVGEPRVLSGYRWAPGGYEPLPLDERGRLLAPVVNLFLRIDEGDRLICEDPETGEEVGSYARLHEELVALQGREAEREQEMEGLVERARLEARAKEEAESRAADLARAKADAETRAADAARARADADARAALAESQAAAHLAEIAALRAALAGRPGTP